MRSEDRAAIILIADVLARHLEGFEDKEDPGLLPSDSVRGAILTLSGEDGKESSADLAAARGNWDGYDQ